eukprot:tig00000254_g22588.t1
MEVRLLLSWAARIAGGGVPSLEEVSASLYSQEDLDASACASSEALDAWRRTGDAPFDDILQHGDIPAHGRGRGALEELEQALEAAEGEPRARLQRALDALRPAPEDDDAGTRLGRELFLSNAALCSGLLFCGSLPFSYTASAGAAVLAGTGRMSRVAVRRRLFETTQFVHAVMTSGVAPGSAGHAALADTRLMHARVRHRLRRSGRWDEAALGVPINQEDMAGTLFVFCGLIALGLRALGASVSREEEESYVALWRAAGRVLGVVPDLLPRSPRHHFALGRTIAVRQCKPGPVGQKLASDLFAAFDRTWPGFLPAEASHQLCRSLLGPDLADGLGLQRSARWALLWAAARLATRALSLLRRCTPRWRAWRVERGARGMERVWRGGLEREVPPKADVDGAPAAACPF